jgi:uncharacterized protein with HEPN domain
MPKVPLDEIRANGIDVAHLYQGIDPDILWATLSQDVPHLAFQVERWRARELSREQRRWKRTDQDRGLDLGF